jgi:hypothetical protein
MYPLSYPFLSEIPQKTGKTILNHQKDGFLPKNFPKKPSRRRNRLAKLASKTFAMVILSAKVYFIP